MTYAYFIKEEPKPFKFEIEKTEEGNVKLVYLGEYEEFESKKELEYESQKC